MENPLLLKIGLYALFFCVVAAMTLAASLAMLFFIPFVALKALWVLGSAPFRRGGPRA